MDEQTSPLDSYIRTVRTHHMCSYTAFISCSTTPDSPSLNSDSTSQMMSSVTALATSSCTWCVTLSAYSEVEGCHVTYIQGTDYIHWTYHICTYIYSMNTITCYICAYVCPVQVSTVYAPIMNIIMTHTYLPVVWVYDVAAWSLVRCLHILRNSGSRVYIWESRHTQDYTSLNYQGHTHCGVGVSRDNTNVLVGVVSCLSVNSLDSIDQSFAAQLCVIGEQNYDPVYTFPYIGSGGRAGSCKLLQLHSHI